MIGGRPVGIWKCAKPSIATAAPLKYRPFNRFLRIPLYIQLMRQKRPENWLELSILTFANEYFYFCPIGIAKISDSVFYNHH